MTRVELRSWILDEDRLKRYGFVKARGVDDHLYWQLHSDKFLVEVDVCGDVMLFRTDIEGDGLDVEINDEYDFLELLWFVGVHDATFKIKEVKG